ncbi:DUF4156 domain-containing protein [Moritella dasanensis]|uniref:DUF4156 domain-containing protein n=1 Tax=Moritella dasanensis TaxID=428031 RepID=UPI0002D60B95|nr:DUF4156 domain-containing protein [Moritella dasanensis]
MIFNHFKILFIFITALTLTSCSLFDIQPLDDTTNVIKIYDRYEHIAQCTFVNELVGSEGTWYNYLFISNTDLTLGSIHDLKNQANAMGANAIHIQYNLSFNTSVTFFAQAYDCPQ